MANSRKKFVKIPPKNKFLAILKGVGVYILIAAAALIFFAGLSNGGNDRDSVPLSQIVSNVKDKQVEKLEVEGDKVTAVYIEKNKIETSRKESGDSIYQILKNSDVDPKTVTIEIKDISWQNAWASLLGTLLPIIVMVALFAFIFRQAKDAGQGIFSFGQSRARLFNKDSPQIKFADVAGVDEAKKELFEVVEFLKTPEKFRALGARTPKGVLLVGPAGTGKCVTGDTIIWTNKGLMEIREVPRYYFVGPDSNQVYGAGLASFNIDKTLSQDQLASHWYDLGEQQTFKIRLAQGYSVEGTPEHPLVVMGDDGSLKFRELEDIKVGDFVAVQYGREMFGNLNLVDNDTAYLMGILTGDGNMSHASRIGLTSIDEEIIEFFKSYIQSHYPKSAITFREQSYLVSNWDFKKQLYQLGMSYLLSFDKTVPPTILQAPKEIQIAFLQGLFDTDASVEKNRSAFEYTTVSEKMARQVQMMLLNLGIIVSLNIKGRKENGYYKDVYRLTITGAPYVAFSQKVGFRLNRKQKLLIRKASLMTKVNTNIDIIPKIGHLIEQSWRELSQKKLSNEKLSKVIDKVRRRGRVSRQVLKEYVAFASPLDVAIPHLEYLRSLLESNLFFSKVVDKSENFARVYDFTIPQTHSFLGNGLLNHNTLLSRAVAGEAGVPFYSIAGSEFMEMLVGVGASRVRDMFLQAKKNSPSIIFIDEVESIGRMRGMGGMGGHDEREQTLNQILVEMDGFNPNDSVIVIAATNRPDLLDPALVRPGRFDRRVVLGLPDIEERKAIIELHMKGKPFTADVSLEKLARRTVGFSGADLANMINEAAILAARENKTAIDEKDLEEAATKEKLGPQRKRMQSESDRKLSAYHEAGHAIVGHFLKLVDPVHRISIVSRGMSGGHTMFPPTEDRSNETKQRLIDQITAALGGRAAEEAVFDDISTGATSDIEVASSLARQMVTQYGMSALGPINVSAKTMFGAWRGLDEGAEISPQLQNEIDREIRKILDNTYKMALTLVRKHKIKLDKVAKSLLEKETLDGVEFEKLVGKKSG